MLLLTILLAIPAHANDVRPERGTLGVVLENDLFYDIDRHYTNGLKIVWIPGARASAPAWGVTLARLLPWFPDEGEVHPGYAFGQSMYTPSSIKVAQPPADERPYAGWLYGTLGLGVGNGKQLDIFTLTVGTVGPSSLAERSQELLHAVVDANQPRGWNTQLGDEPGLIITSQRHWRGAAHTTLLGNRIDLTPHVGAALGNVFTYASTGLTLRYGPVLPHDFGPPRVEPGVPGVGDFSPASPFGWYLFFGMEGRAVARNLFLDGNTLRDSHRVEREDLVGDLQAGLVLNWRDLRVSYTHVLRTREFHAQEDEDDFGALSVSVKR